MCRWRNLRWKGQPGSEVITILSFREMRWEGWRDHKKLTRGRVGDSLLTISENMPHQSCRSLLLNWSLGLRDLVLHVWRELPVQFCSPSSADPATNWCPKSQFISSQVCVVDAIMYSFCLLVQGTTADNNYQKRSCCCSSCQDLRNCHHEVYQNKDTHRLADKKVFLPGRQAYWMMVPLLCQLCNCIEKLQSCNQGWSVNWERNL